MSGRRLVTNDLLLFLSLATSVIVAAATIVSLVNVPSFQGVIIDVCVVSGGDSAARSD